MQKNPIEEYEDYQRETEPENLNSSKKPSWGCFLWIALALLFLCAIFSN